jgi:hypothetical protein
MTNLKDYWRRVVDGAPPLSTEQRDRLALLLAGENLPSGRQVRHEALGEVWSPDRPGADLAAPSPYVGDGALAEMLGRR